LRIFGLHKIGTLADEAPKALRVEAPKMPKIEALSRDAVGVKDGRE